VGDVKWPVGILAASLALAGCAVSTGSPSTSPQVTAVPAPTESPTQAPASASAAPSASFGAVPSGRIAFDRIDAAAGGEGNELGTFILGADGAEGKIPIPIGSDPFTPVWSPDGQRLVGNVFLPPSGPGTPAIVNADGTRFTVVRAKAFAGDLNCTDWSPDGSTLVCSSGNDVQLRKLDGMYKVRTDGTHLVRLSTSPFHDTVGGAGECGGGDGRGVFSPDGTRIAFIRQKCGTGPDPSSDESAAIEVVKPDGTGVHEIVAQGGVRSHLGSQLSWSPDGSEIVFGSQDGDLYLVHPDGTGLTHIPIDYGDARHLAAGPDWSPDGRLIVFSLYLGSRNSADLYVVAPDGSGLTRITDTLGAEDWPRWGPPAGG
jgi:Tol biopolymer transport system component